MIIGPAFGGAAALPGCKKKKKELLPPFFIPASALAPESDVGPNDFTYLMPCHRVDGNRRLPLTLRATWPRCLPAADISDAAPGASRALTWAARSLARRITDITALSGWKWKKHQQMCRC